MIVVSGWVAVVVVVLGVLAYIADGVGKVRQRSQRKSTVGDLYRPQPSADEE